MPVGKHIDPKLRELIVAQIRDSGISVVDASKQHSVHPKTIYSWLRSGVVNGSANLILENNRLRKENDQLYNMLGRATADLKRPKK